jgi:WD40 repeat protein
MRISITQLIMGTSLVALLLVLWNSEGLGRRRVMIESISFSRDGSQLAVAKLLATDAEMPSKRSLTDVSRSISRINVDGGSPRRILQKDVRIGTHVYFSKFWSRGRQSIVMSPGNDRIVATSFDGGDFIIADVENPKKSRIGLTHFGSCLAVSGSGNRIVCSGDSQLTVWDLEVSKAVLQAPTQNLVFLFGAVVFFDEDESHVVVVCDDTIQIWEIESGESAVVLRSLPSDEFWLNTAVPGPDDSIVVCGSKWVRQYDLDGNQISSLQENGGCSLSASSAGGKRLATIGNHVLKLYEMVPEPKLIQEFEVDGSTAVAISQDGSQVAVGDSNGDVSLYEFTSGQQVWQVTPSGRKRMTWPIPIGCLFVWSFLAAVMHVRSKQN